MASCARRVCGDFAVVTSQHPRYRAPADLPRAITWSLTRGHDVGVAVDSASYELLAASRRLRGMARSMGAKHCGLGGLRCVLWPFSPGFCCRSFSRLRLGAKP